MISYRRGKHVKYNNEGLENIFFESVCKLREDYYFMQNISGRVRWSPKAVNDFELPVLEVVGLVGICRGMWGWMCGDVEELYPSGGSGSFR